MPGKIIKEVLIDRHYCSGKPKLWRWKYTLLNHGTQWQCDECNAIWELDVSYSYLDGWYRKWIKLSGNPK